MEIKNNNISSLILYPFFILQSILFYVFVACGSEIYFNLSNYFQTPDKDGLMPVSGQAMRSFPIFFAIILSIISITFAIIFSKKINKSKLFIGLIISFFVYILAPFFYRTGSRGFIDFGPTFDMIVLCFIFWFQPGLFFITSLIMRKISKKQSQSKISDV